MTTRQLIEASWKSLERLKHEVREWTVPHNLKSRGNSAHRRLYRSSMFILSVLLIGSSTLYAQVITADAVGTVTDGTGAIIPGAKVTIRNVATHETRSALTNQAGDYTFSLLPIGVYSIRTEMSGFKAYAIQQVPLSAGDRARFDIQMQVGDISESVEVTTAPPLLQTDSSAVGDTLPAAAVQDLPLNGRNYINLVQSAVGVNAGPSTSIAAGGRPDDRRQSSSFSANGQSELFNNQLIDGLDNNERAQGFIGVRPSIDGIQEVKVDTNSYTAEVGRSAGAVVNVLTKSGTNNFHGSLYEFFRNDIFDSRNVFASTGRKPEYRQNQYGGSVGGPIVKDRTFFFGDFEQYRIVQGQTSTETVPTAYEEAHPGDFSDVGGPTVPTASLNPIGLKYFALYPAPNKAGTVNNFSYSPNKTQNSTTLDARVDHRISNNDTFFARYAYNPVTTYIPGALPSVNGVQPGGNFTGWAGPSDAHTQNLQFNYLHVFNPNLLLELKAGYTRINIQTFPLNYGTNDAAKFGLPNANLTDDPTTSYLTAMAMVSGDYASVGDGLYNPILDLENTFQESGAVTYNRGVHSIKVGAALIRRQVDYYQSTFPAGFYVYLPVGAYSNSVANLLAGTPFEVERGNSLVKPEFRGWEPSAYVQDNWRVTQRLTLNLGIRYEIYTPILEKHNYQSNFDIATLRIITGAEDPRVGIQPDYANVSPRVGFADSLGHNVVLRGGFGISYYPLQTQRQIENPNPPFAYSYAGYYPKLSDGPPVPELVDADTFASNPQVTALSANPINLRQTYVEQFNLMLQKEIGANVITVGYVGELGRRMQFQPNADLPAPPGAGNPTPAYKYQAQLPYVNTITYTYGAAESSYHAMQASFQRRYSGGLTVNANYTYARGLTDSFDGGGGYTDPYGLLPTDVRYDYGNSDIDVRHRISMSLDYALPFGKSLKGATGYLARGWQVNSLAYWQTGTPITVENGDPQINLPGVSADRPNQIASTRLSNPSIHEFFNVAAFEPQTLGTPGDEGRNQIYGPHDRRVDVSLFKDFPVREGVIMQFRAECYNISNTPNYAEPNAEFSLASGVPAPGGTFGAISGTAQNEVPRQFQFALKLHF